MSVNLQNRYVRCIPANILFGEDHRFTRAREPVNYELGRKEIEDYADIIF